MKVEFTRLDDWKSTFQAYAGQRILSDERLSLEKSVFFIQSSSGGSKERTTLKSNDTGAVWQ